MKIVVVVVFLDEERYLPTLLESVRAQRRLPDRLLLVDDGSADLSPQIALDFAERHPFATVLRRPHRPAAKDRLITASELRSFQWAVAGLGGDYEVVAKVDADLSLPPGFVVEMERRFAEDPRLGIAGGHLCEVGPGGVAARLPGRPDHVHGATKFYRRECYEEIAPVPAVHGWDMVDEVKARSRGWRTATFDVPGGDALHLRPMGAHDGMLRGYRRWGESDYVAGVHPLVVAATAVHRMRRRPWVVGGLNYVAGWSAAGLRRVPRIEAEVRTFARQEQLTRMRDRVASLTGRGRPT